MDYSHRRLIDVLRRFSAFDRASPSDITTDDLQNQFNITDEQIDIPIGERDVHSICSSRLTRYRSPWLWHYGMEYSTLEVELFDSLSDMRLVLVGWQCENPLTATFRNLLNIALEHNSVSFARHICYYISIEK